MKHDLQGKGVSEPSASPHDIGTQPDHDEKVGIAWAPLAMVLLAVVVILLLFFRWQSAYLDMETHGFSKDGLALEAKEATAMVERIEALLDEPLQPDVAAKLSSGRLLLSDQLLRVFITPAYLRQQPDDEDFIRHAHEIILDESPDAGQQQEAELVLQETQSRMGVINALLQKIGHEDPVAISPQPTRLRTVYVADNLPAEGSEIVGRLSVESELRLTGPAASMKLYVDDQVRASQLLTSQEPSLQKRHEIEWNSAAEPAGEYELSFLVLTDDGRGYWQRLSTYQVPVIVPLEAAKLHKDQMAAEEEASRWYVMQPDEDALMLNLVEASQPLTLELFDEHRNFLANTQSHPQYPAALRHRIEDELAEDGMDRPFYVRARPHDAAPGSLLDFSLLPAYAIARPLSDPQRVLAVQDVRDDELHILDESGHLAWQPKEEFDFIDPDARLGKIQLVDEAGLAMDFVPGFTLDETFFALVTEENTARLSLELQALEGSAAGIDIHQEARGGTQSIESETIELLTSENRLTIDVTGFSGNKQRFEISILRPPHDGPFDATLQDFPGSYHDWLWYLHLLHPQYQVRADRTGIDFQEFVDAQAQADRSLVDANHSPASWVRPDSPVYDGVSWKAASRPVVAHFGDPRNFLDPVNVFQFEKMVYDPEIHTREGLQTMLSSSFMAEGNAQGVDYVDLIMEAGETAQISPYFLAAKIIQEMGLEGQSPLAFGTLEGYEGAYNFYNINSIPNPDVPDGARINGARFALYGLNPDQGELSEDEQRWLIPWNTPERGIVGGAIWISERYVQVGQDTLYLQKFDLVGNQGLYMRQYAQNIQMAWAEGRRTYRAYADMDLLEQPFIFKIPVFDGMPAAPSPLP